METLSRMRSLSSLGNTAKGSLVGVVGGAIDRDSKMASSPKS